MEIQLMDEKLYKILFNSEAASYQVHSVFRRACNLLTVNGLWVTLVSNNRWLPPNGIRVNHNKDFRELYQQGEVIRFLIEDPKIKRLNLHLNFGDHIQPDTLENKKLKLDYMKAYLELRGKTDAIGKLHPPENIEIALNLLENALEEQDFDRLYEAAKGLIGFGSGLTPSMDDYLTGRILMWKASMMQGLTAGEQDYSAVIEKTAERTTPASEWMIRFAAEGRCSEEILQFLHAFAAKTSGSIFEESFLEVLEIGSTSGEDMMYGMWREGTRLVKKYEGGSN